MRQGLRRTIGLGGAAFVAVGAALVLTLPASAHETVATTKCASDGSNVVIVDISTVPGKNYTVDKDHPKNNKVWILDANNNTIFSDMFGATYSNSVASSSFTPPLDGSVAHDITVRAEGFDGQGNDTIPLTTPVCKESQPTPTTKTAPPTTTTVAPPNHEAATTTPVVAAASSQLPNTGVNAGMPLMIAGILVVAGGGILLWLRLAAKRRSTNN